jgi:hypothetical protein
MRAYHLRLLNATTHEIAVAMATMVGRPPAAILAQLASERAKSPDVENIWREAAKALGSNRNSNCRDRMSRIAQ